MTAMGSHEIRVETNDPELAREIGQAARVLAEMYQGRAFQLFVDRPARVDRYEYHPAGPRQVALAPEFEIGWS